AAGHSSRPADPAKQPRRDRPGANAGHRWQAGFVATLEEAAHFVDEAAGDPGVDALVDSRIELVALQVQPHLEAVDWWLLEGRLPRRERPAGGVKDLERANHAAHVL